jgi:hypothetical protein
MKRYFTLFSFLFFLVFLVDGQENLGTVYFQNPQYLVSFDKVMYPGYKIVLENFTVREYLLNKKISEKVLAEKIEASYIEGMGYILEDKSIENWWLSAEIKFNEKFEIAEELYNLQSNLENGDELSLRQIVSKTSVFKRAKNKQVEEVQIEIAINKETNTISSTENILKTRAINPDEVADINGNVYRTVTIGGLRWMAENLRATSFNNGDVIPNLNESQWANTASSGLIKSDADGNFYNFYSFIDERNVCPTGFHSPGTWEIENLYNTITPYGGRTKVSLNKVKQKVYPSLLTPVIAPITIGANSVLYSASLAVDLAYTVPWVLIDGLILGPIFGWETVKAQKHRVYKSALKFSNYIDTNGFSVKIEGEDDEESFLDLNIDKTNDKAKQVPLKYWNKFTMVKLVDGVKVIINDINEIQKYKDQVKEYDYKLKYSAFPTATDNIGFFATAGVIDAVGLIPILPYRTVTGASYPMTKFRLNSESLKLNASYQPVLTFLLEKGSKEELSDPFGFSLNFDNSIYFPEAIKYKKEKSGSVGLTYDDGGEPQVWGLGDKNLKVGHELRYFYNDMHASNAKKMATRIRCVSNDMVGDGDRKE